MSFARPDRKPLPAFAYTAAGCAAYVVGWEERAARYRQEASAHGITAEQRQLMLANAHAAEAQAQTWRLRGRGRAKAS